MNTKLTSRQVVVRVVACTWLLCCVALAVGVLRSHDNKQTPASFAATKLITYPTKLTAGVATRAIEDIRVGERVLARNPQISDEERKSWTDPDPAQLRHLKLTMPLPDGSELKIDMLRPLDWLEAAEAAPGATIWLNLLEMGAEGEATVQSIRPCREFERGDGQIVTATFSHPPSHAVLDVRFEGESHPIGVTDNHLFWSADREDFFPIGEMAVGERVETYSGDTKLIEQKLPRPGPQTVYNLEVYGEHVYFVGRGGVLAHNAYETQRRRGVPYSKLESGDVDEYRNFNRGKARIGDDFEGHEVLQSAWLREHQGLSRSKGVGSRNPSISLSEADHKIVNTLQEAATGGKIATQTAKQNIEANVRVLREAQKQGVAITDRQIKEITRRAVRFAQAHNIPLD